MGLPIASFDILPMSPATGAIKVALAIRTEKGELKTWESVSRRKFLSIIGSYKPRYIGTDNPYEILYVNEDLSTFCRRLPPVTDLVQVNSDHRGRLVSLGSLISKHRIPWERRSAMKTAIAMVSLIQRGVGVILEPFEEETLIKVGQPRRHRKGGWSQGRYERHNEEVVVAAVRKIEAALNEAEYEYDLVINSTKYGAKNATIHTFIPRVEVGRVLSKVNLRPAKVRLESPARTSIYRKYLKSDKILPVRERFLPRIIVGIDPGLTLGMAIMDLNGRPIAVRSQRQISRGEILSTLSEFGVPVIFCSDVNPVPQLVAKLAATFDAEVLSPNHQLSKIEKREMAVRQQMQVSNNHEMDALAAVVTGYNLISPRFKNLDTEDLSRKEVDLAKTLILKGLNSSDARNAVLSLRKEHDAPQVIHPEYETMTEKERELQSRVISLLKKYAESENTISYLLSKLNQLETEVESERRRKLSWLNEVQNIKDEQTRWALQQEILQKNVRELKALKQEVKLLKAKEVKYQRKIKGLQESLWISLRDGSIPLKVMQVFSRKGIEELYHNRLAEGDLILIIDPTGGGPKTAQLLVEKKPRAVYIYSKWLSPEAEEILFEARLPVIDASTYNIKVMDTVAIISPTDFERSLKEYEIELGKKLRKREKEGMVNALRNYQFERERLLSRFAVSYDDFEFEEEEE